MFLVTKRKLGCKLTFQQLAAGADREKCKSFSFVTDAFCYV